MKRTWSARREVLCGQILCLKWLQSEMMYRPEDESDEHDYGQIFGYRELFQATHVSSRVARDESDEAHSQRNVKDAHSAAPSAAFQAARKNLTRNRPRSPTCGDGTCQPLSYGRACTRRWEERTAGNRKRTCYQRGGKQIGQRQRSEQ